MSRYDQIEERREESPIKMMVMGDSGTGKTGALAALANAGFRLFIMDFDRGTPIMGAYLTPEGAKNVYVKTFTDKLKMDGLMVLPDGPPKAFRDAMNACNKWMEGEESMGGPMTWGARDILVLDSLSFFSKAAMRDTLQANTLDDMMKGGKEAASARFRLMHPWPTDYGEAQNKLESFFALTYSDHVKCNLIVTAHIEFRGKGGKRSVKDKESGMVYIQEIDSESEGTGQPVSVGKKLSPILRRYFNTVVMTDVEGSGQSAKHVLRTVSTAQIPLKNELPTVVPPSIEIKGGDPNSGLARLFQIIRTGKKT